MKYNLCITLLSVVIAFGVGTAEILGLVGERFELRGQFWNWVGSLDLNAVGFVIVGLFVVVWGGALLLSKRKAPDMTPPAAASNV